MKTSLLLFAAGIAAFLLAEAPARGAAPNLSGEWKLNLAKSNYGKFPAPLAVMRKITHNDPKLALTITQTGPQGDVTSKLAYTPHGKEGGNQVSGGGGEGRGGKDGGKKGD